MGEPDPLSRFLAWLLRALRSDMEAGWRSDGDLISLGNALHALSWLEVLAEWGGWEIRRLPQVARLRRLLLSRPADLRREAAAAAAAQLGLVSALRPRCALCGRAGRWIRLREPPAGIPPTARWRWDRYENHVPLCARHRWAAGDPLADMLWDGRAAAFRRFHEAAAGGHLPPPDPDFPLWPEPTGCRGWEAGCGCAVCAARDPEARRIDLSALLERMAEAGWSPSWRC
jgi:hypothetical protein